MIAIAPIPIPVARAVLVILVIVVPATRPTIVDTLVPTFAEVPVPAATVTDQDYIGLGRRLFGERKRQRVGIACSQYGHSADGDMDIAPMATVKASDANVRDPLTDRR